ncbi:MAG: molybdenum cofactor biosynthesis protein MoaE [Candidatus Riflebacteria bacterium]|nr:molybdenum cofactor biosynthesis protein MoaE [Candidatus Riflebacteria bacterium]
MHRLVREPLDCARIMASVTAPGAGAVCVFVGTVRNHNEGRSVLRIEYEAYEEMALEQLAAVEAEIHQRFPVTGVAIVHRLGLLEVGEASVVVAVSTGHRDEGFAACRYGIDRIKELVPIWKKEFTDSGASWVGMQVRTSW